jgi:hypothetical protein
VRSKLAIRNLIKLQLYLNLPLIFLMQERFTELVQTPESQRTELNRLDIGIFVIAVASRQARRPKEGRR